MEFYYFAVICMLVSPALSHSDGAPKEACVDLTPQHGVPSQSSPAPYSLGVSSVDVKTGDSIKLTIKGNGGSDKIRGFLVQARLGNNPVGTFTAGPNSQAIDCSGPKDTITHTKIAGDGVNEVTFNWTPPSDLKGPVSFLATVAQRGDLFWVGKLSQTVNIV